MELNYDQETGSWIAKDFTPLAGFSHGIGCIIEPNVTVGANVRLGHRVLLKSGTIVLNNATLADDCRTTGLCIIGNNVTCRTGTTISKGVILNDLVFVGAGVMTSHTKHVWHGRMPDMLPRQHVTVVGYGAILGSSSNLKAGVHIGPGAIVAYGSNVLDNVEPLALYAGNPAIRVSDVRGTWAIKVPEGYANYRFSRQALRHYLPHVL